MIFSGKPVPTFRDDSCSEKGQPVAHGPDSRRLNFVVILKQKPSSAPDTAAGMGVFFQTNGFWGPARGFFEGTGVLRVPPGAALGQKKNTTIKKKQKKKKKK